MSGTCILIIGIKYVGPEIAIQIGGMIPVSVAILGNLILKEFPFTEILIPILISLTGLIFLNYFHLTTSNEFSVRFVLGLVACLGALILWSLYGVYNADFLKKNQHIAASTWTNMLGIMTLLQVMTWGFLGIIFIPHTSSHLKELKDIVNLCLWTASLGIIASWLGTTAWNTGSKMLPITLAGQLIVIEPILGLFFVFLLKGELPNIFQFLGFSTCFLGIILTLKKIQQLQFQERTAAQD